jgi:hypothetical protein
MLKKAFSLMMIILLLVFSTGFTVCIEHCGMRKTSLYSLSAEQGCCCSEEIHAKCCHQTKIEIKKIDADYYSVAGASLPTNEASLLLLSDLKPMTPAFLLFSEHVYYRDHAPPEPGVSSLILLRSLLL